MLSDPEMKAMAQEEIGPARETIERLEGELQVLLLPRDPDDGRSVFLEIRAGTGGDESALLPAIYCACMAALPKAAAGASRSCPATRPR